MAAQDPLSLLEAQLQDLHAALLSSDPFTLEQGAAALRQAAAALSQAQSGPLDAQTGERVRAIAAQLTRLRDQLARVLALTQQQAATLLPPVDAVTYGGQATTAARIYRAPG